ncbi:snoRNA-binding rRNA-processing protein utp10 [Tilletia horrida]|uniref:U3 small nucleolar RNA-associated protein 10 n=1 Tax=Tilletia horrida TaxID=155126 RepID=A0AAN6JRI9_9BASI|nr:snoRNA-binding rRNA-processing protein utp10 [Tilletia horrida]KAK0564798.1 snoRNA-binding rRNA-processing protein utp10 [Tilletia horrida]
MASALASQLAGIRSVNAARIATLGGSAGAQHTASYLFPPKTAAAQDLATVHALARNGLEELASHDRWFQTSEWALDVRGGRELLFGETSKSRDRSVLTKDENAQVDQALSQFLTRLAPDITGRSAAKCLEWLVRRFRIHEFNVPLLLGVFMPFHSTPQFARMLKICKIDTSSELLRWVAGLILAPKAAGNRPHRTLISFWAATMIQFSLRWANLGSGVENELGGMGLGVASHNRRGKRQGAENRLEDAQVYLNQILPIAVRCASLVPGEDDVELRTASLMVITALGASFPFSSEAVRATIGSLVSPARADPGSAQDEAIMPLLSGCIALCTFPLSDENFLSAYAHTESEEQYEAARLVSTEAGQTLLGLPTFAECVSEASKRGTDVGPFVQELMVAVARSSNIQLASANATAQSLSKILLSPSLDDQVRQNTARFLLLQNYGGDVAFQQRDVLRIRLLSDLREQQSEIFDEAVRWASSTIRDDKAAEQALWAVLKAIITKSDSLAEASEVDPATTLWLTVHSTSSAQRVLAVRSLHEALADGTLSETDSFASNAFRARISALTEQDADVISAVYANPTWVVSVLGAPEAANLVLNALDADADGASLSRQAVDVHLKFFLGHLLSQDPVAFIPRLVKDVLWGRLLQTKAARKTTDAVATTLRKAKLPVIPADASAEVKVWAHMLEVVKTALEQSRDQRENPEMLNNLVVEPLTKTVLAVQDQDMFSIVIDFVISKTSGSSPLSATQASGRMLSLTLLNRVIVSLKSSDARLPLLAHRLAFGVNLNAIPDASAAQDDAEDILLGASGEGLPQGLAEAIYSKPSHERTMRRLLGVIIGNVLKRLSYTDSTVKLLPIAYGEVAVVVGARLYAIIESGLLSARASQALKDVFWKNLGQSRLSFLGSIWTATSKQLADSVNGLEGSFEGSQSGTSQEAAVAVRQAALRDAQATLAAAVLEKTDDGQTKIQDFQTLVPALLIALQNEHKEVRRTALKALQTIASAEQHAQTPGVEISEYGYDAIYGTSSNDLVYLHYADVCRYLRSLLAEQAAFTNDEQYLAIWHSTALKVVKSDKRKDAEYKNAVVTWLLAHVLAWPFISADIHLLEALRGVSHPSKLKLLVPVLRQYLESGDELFAADGQDAEAPVERQRFVALIFESFDGSAGQVAEDATTGAWNVLLEALSPQASGLIQEYACAAISGTFFKALRPDMAQLLLQHILTGIYEESANKTAHLRSVLRTIPAEAPVFAPVLAQSRERVVHVCDERREAKRARTSLSAEDTQSRASSILAILLEVVGSKDAAGVASLLPELFEVLRVAVEVNGVPAVNADHLTQLTLAALLKGLSGTQAEQSSQITSAIRVDTIISTIKTSQNPQTFQQALSLLNRIASINRDLVLHNVMPIFTFVGSSMLQRDDSYSFEIVHQTLQSIIPAYIQSLHQENKGGEELTLLKRGRSFMRIFTDAATHIPRHRRQTFFKSLLDVLGPRDFLGAICMLLTDRSAHKVAKQTPEAFTESISLPLHLLMSYGISVQITAIFQVFNEIERLWEHRDVNLLEAKDFVFLDRMDRAVREHSERQASPVQQLISLMRLVIATIGSQNMALRIPKLKKVEVRETIDKQVLSCVHKTLKLALVEDADVRTASNQMLETMLQLLSTDGFMSLVNVMVADNTAAAKRTGLALYATRFSAMSVDERVACEGKALPVISAASQIVKTSAAKKESSEALLEALTALKVSISAKSTSLHQSLSTAVSDLLLVGRLAILRDAVRVEAITTISRLVRTIGPRLIPQLNNIVAFVVATLEDGVDGHSSTIVASAFGVLTSALVALPTFMVSHVQSVLAALSKAKLLQAMEHPDFQNALKPLTTLQSSLVRTIPIDKVLAALQKLWADYSKEGSLLSLTSVVTELHGLIENQDQTGMAVNYKAVFRFFLTIFDARRLLSKTIDSEGIAEIEDLALQAFIDMSLKLNESSFRPLFYHIFDWAVLELAEDEQPISDPGLCSRRTVLFKLINALLNKLSGLFTAYYATVLDHTIELLNAFAATELSDVLLWQEVLTSIELTCQFDEGTFWNPTRLSKVSTPIVEQVQVCTDSEDNQRLLASAVAALAQAVGDEDSLQELNDSLLRKTRSGTSAVKAAALLVLDELWSTQAEAMQPFVAQTTPFLAELLDADDNTVLQRTNQLVQSIETVLGESLDSYLQ